MGHLKNSTIQGLGKGGGSSRKKTIMLEKEKQGGPGKLIFMPFVSRELTGYFTKHQLCQCYFFFKHAS